MKRVLIVTLALTTLASVARADVIVPGALAAAEGNFNNGFPFNIAAFGLTSQRYQQVYASSEFVSAVLITGMTFRPDATAGNPFASTLPSVRIDLSTTAFGPDALSTTFATNVGADNTTVFNGALSLSSADTGPVAGPKDFDIDIVFSTPFLYNPTLGHLLLDVRNFGGGSSTFFDAHNVSGDSISRVGTLAGGVSSPTAGFFDSAGLVTQFQTTPVPEPAAFMLLSGGLLALARRMRRRS